MVLELIIILANIHPAPTADTRNPIRDIIFINLSPF